MNDYELARRWVGSPGHLHINAGDVRMVEGLLAEIDRLRTALAARPQEELLAEAIRGFLLEKHLPFDQLDSWADEIVAIVSERRAALAARPQPDLRLIRRGVIDGVKSHLSYDELPCPPDIDPLVDRIMTCIAVAVAGSATPTGDDE